MENNVTQIAKEALQTANEEAIKAVHDELNQDQL